MEFRVHDVSPGQLAKALEGHLTAEGYRVAAYAYKGIGETRTIMVSRDPLILLRVEDAGGNGYDIGTAALQPHGVAARYDLNLSNGWGKAAVASFLSTLARMG